jgi:hypothetical protein
MSLTKKGRKVRSISGITFPIGRFADAIAAALHREYGGTHAAVKTVAGLTGANGRAVKNWFEARNGPSGDFLIALCRHSEQVLETVLLLAGREKQMTAQRVAAATRKFREILALLDELQEP